MTYVSRDDEVRARHLLAVSVCSVVVPLLLSPLLGGMTALIIGMVIGLIAVLAMIATAEQENSHNQPHS